MCFSVCILRGKKSIKRGNIQYYKWVSLSAEAVISKYTD